MVQFRANKDIDQIVEPILKYFIVAFNLCTFVSFFAYYEPTKISFPYIYVYFL